MLSVLDAGFWQALGMAVLCGGIERLFPQLRRGVHSHELDGRAQSDGQ